jgi:drug/metabolite transporter (DMT)-like permease
MLGMAAIGTVGQLVLIAAFSTAQASALAPFTYFGLIVAAVLGYLVFGDLPDAATVLGAGVIVGSGLYVWHRERLRAAVQAERR